MPTAPYRVIYPIAGATLYAYPVNGTYPLASYATHRVLMTETDQLYSATVDLAKSTDWAVFEGASIPASYDEALFQDNLDASSNNNGMIAVNITPGTISQQNRGNKSLIKLYYKEATTVVVPTSVNLVGQVVRFIVENKDKSQVLLVPNGSISVTETSFSVPIGTEVTDNIKTYIWSLRQETTNKVLVEGTIQVDYSPYKV